MENLQEAPVVAAVGKGLAVAGKAVAKGVAAMAKGAAKATGSAAKGAAKGAAKTSKPVARKLTTRRNVKNPRYKKLEKDDKGNIVKGKEFDKKLYDQDGNKKTQGYMSTIDSPAGRDGKIKDTRSISGHPDNLRQKKKEEDARDKKVQDTKKSLKKGVKKTADKAGEYGKKSISATSGAFGTSSFAKEGVTFKDYLNKL